jgi:hypothetical protein
MMTTDCDKLSKAVARPIAVIGEAVPDLTMARDPLDRCHRPIQHRKDKRLGEWIADAKPSLMASFASGIAQDHAAVKAALTEPWSNGQTEGAEHETEIPQAPDVWPGQARFAPCTPARCTMKAVCSTNFASEPFSHAQSHAGSLSAVHEGFWGGLK